MPHPHRGPGPGVRRRRATVLVAGLLAALVAWGVLVLRAIEIGRAARADGGATLAWLLVLATLGAAACLFLAILLGTRLVATLRGRAPRVRGGRRAAR